MAGKIGPYALLDELGRGGMGAVFRARDERTGAIVALKVLTSPEAGERFQREVRTAAAVRHANVVAVFDAGVADGRAFLVLELVRGGDLRRVLRERGKLPWREAAGIGAEIARGLEAIHARGLIHRDLKPENVLRDEHGRSKVGDFGLARRVDASSLTRTGEVLGTLAYMAPEQADGRRDLDGRTDLYALGAILYEALAGTRPFAGTGVALMKAVMFAAPPPLAQAAPEAPERFARLVESLLAKDPAQRPPGAGSVAEELESLARTPEKEEEPARGARFLIALGVVVALVLAVSIGALVARGSRAVPPPVSSPTPRPLPQPASQPAPPRTQPVVETPRELDGMHLVEDVEARLARGDASRASALVKAALDKDDRDPFAWFAKARIAEDAHEEEGVRLRSVQKARDNSIHGIELLEPKGRLDECLTLVNALLAVDSTSFSLHSVRAAVYSRMGREDEALSDLDVCVKRPDNPGFDLLRRSEARLHKGDLDGAREDLRASDATTGWNRALARREYGERLLRWTQARLLAGELLRAAKPLVLLLEADPRDREAADLALAVVDAASRAGPGVAADDALAARDQLDERLIHVCFVTERFADMERVVTAQLVLHPRNPRSLSTRGEARLRLGRFDDAIADLDSALALDLGRERGLAFGRRAEARAGRGDLALAHADAEEALRVDPGSRNAARLLIDLRLREKGGDAAEALRAVAPGLGGLERAVAFERIGDTEFGAKQLEKAIEAFDESAKAAAPGASLLINRGMSRLALLERRFPPPSKMPPASDPEVALLETDAKDAIAAASQNPSGYFLRSKVEGWRGEWRAARDDYERYVVLLGKGATDEHRKVLDWITKQAEKRK